MKIHPLLGFISQYDNDKSFNLKIRCYTALAFLPVLDVIDGFDELTEDESVPEVFTTYFQSTYIGIFRSRGPNRKRSTPWRYNIGGGDITISPFTC